MTAQSETVPENKIQPLIRPHMPELDSVRGIAVLMVFLYHGFYWTDLALRPYVFGERNWLARSTQLGLLGVELFFVLSGFLITGILLDTRERPDYFKRFYTRRALRILPALIALLALLWILGVAQWPFLLASLLFAANLVPYFGVPRQYIPLWSLAVEEQFYLFWPQAVRRLSRKWLVILVTSIVLVMPAIRWFAFSRGERDGFYTWLVADGLALGALLAIYFRTKRATRDAAFRAGLAFVTTGMLILLIGKPFGILQGTVVNTTIVAAAFLPTAWYFLCAGGITLALLAGTGRWRRLVTPGWLRYVGRISYGLYLIHLLTFDVFDKVVRYFSPTLDVALRGTVSGLIARFIVAGGIAVLIAVVSREYFESFFLKLRDRKRPPELNATVWGD